MVYDAPNAADTKAALRRSYLASRAARPHQVRTNEDRLRTDAILDFINRIGAETVATYLSRPAEPDTLNLAHELHTAGIRLLVPVLTTPSGTPLPTPDWAWYPGRAHLRQGLWNVPEPTTPAIGPSALAQADVVVCAALAVDTSGHRLGVGGGWHDRALEYARPGAIFLAAVFSDEVVDILPHEDHDVAMHVIASSAGLIHVS